MREVEGHEGGEGACGRGRRRDMREWKGREGGGGA